MIQISGLTKDYGSTRVLRNINLSIEAGESVAIVGESGARILERILHITERDSQLASLRPVVGRELRRTRRHLRAIRIGSGKSFLAPILGWGLEQFERYRLGVYRRTPWYPEMKVSRV